MIDRTEIIREWFREEFKTFLQPYPSEELIRKVFNDIEPEFQLSTTSNSRDLLDEAMAIDEIYRFVSYDHEEEGIVALTFGDDANALEDIYQFCKSKEGETIRSLLKIDRHWFIISEDLHKVQESEEVQIWKKSRQFVESLDHRLWLPGEKCVMVIDKSEIIPILNKAKVPSLV
jgi:hypothetical protein